MLLKVETDKKCDFLTTSNRELEKVLSTTNTNLLEMNKKQKIFDEQNEERLVLFMKIDDLELKYRSKFEQFLALEQTNLKLDTESTLIKQEIVEAT